MNKPLTLSELPEAAEAYLIFKAAGDSTTGLMELLQDQTEFIQKRFWATVDAKAIELAANFKAVN